MRGSTHLIKELKMATAKRARHEKGFYRSVERGVRIRAEKVRQKKESCEGQVISY
jgi:hypothetical protein